MQKQPKHNSPGSRARSLATLVSVLVLSFICSSFNVIRVNTVTFTAADGLQVTADEYIVEPGNPYVLLFHEQGSSRGEFSTIARRLCRMDYNCLAVDLRNGGNSNYVSNETTKELLLSKLESGVDHIEQDMLAAINYAYQKTEMPVVLFGSGSNGSLSLKVAVENEYVRAVVAMSPGEYFLPGLSIQDTVAHIQKPVFITSSKLEFPYVSELASGINLDYLTLFEPKQGSGGRGTESLSPEYQENTEYWVALILFFKDLM